MPLYEYQCEDCGHIVELIQKFSDAPLSTCSSCGGRLERLLSAPAIQFKGSGWYITDYARQNNGRKTNSPETPSADSGGKKTTSEKTT